MIQPVRPRVRPTLFIFIGTVGEQIREYLSPYYYGPYRRRLQDPPTPSTYHLLASLHEVVRDAVALLQVVTEGPQADAWNPIAFPVMKDFPHDQDMPTGQGPLATMILNAMFSVQLDRRIDKIRNAGYEVPNTRTQVFIVGEPNKINAPWFAKTLEIVRRCARSLNFEVPICYVLNCYDLGNDYSLTLKKSLSSSGLKWANYEVANFSYLYEPLIPYPTPLTVMPASVRYATAEALLALVATSITSLPLIEDGVLLNPHQAKLEDYAPYVGNLSTSMIRFPRPSIVRYCATRLASELVQRWRDDLNISSLSPNQRDRLRDEGIEVVNRIEGWIVPSEPRPLAGENDWPSFDILRQANLPGVRQPAHIQQEAYEQLLRETEKLFSLFSYEDLLDEYHHRTDRSQTWAEFTYERFNRASSFYEQWERQAHQAWNILQATIEDYVRYEIDRRWSSGKDGFALARVFVNQLDSELAELTYGISQWRRRHHLDYRAQRTHAAKLAEDDLGRWNITDNDQSLQHGQLSAQTTGGQAHPTMNHTVLTGNAGASRAAGMGGNPPTPGVPPHLPPAESRIARDLRSRTDWKQNQIPSIASLCSVGLFGLIASGFSTPATGLSSTMLIPVIATLAVVITLGNIGFHWKRRKEHTAAQKDVVTFYINYYNSRCTHREDLQRTSLIRTLSTHVMHMRQRIENMQAFFDDRANTARHDANEAHSSLFAGPAASRDVFIADGERLEERGTHTLENIASKVSQTRKNHPLADWHRTLDMLINKLAYEFQMNSISLLDMREDQFQEYLYQFTEPIVESYLTGSLVDISEALNKPDVWREVLEQARRPLYTANTGTRDPYELFICGSPQALARGAQYLPSNAVQLPMNGNESLLIVGLFRDGSPRGVDANMLFPVKKSTPGGGSPGSGAGGSGGPVPLGAPAPGANTVPLRPPNPRSGTGDH